MKGVPNIGSDIYNFDNLPTKKEIGVVKEAPSTPPIEWKSPAGGTVTLEEPGPPPWELNPDAVKDNTDARRFVRVPDNWELRWLNPRLIEHWGTRDWEIVSAHDPRITVLIPQMISPEGYIRRGGSLGGDILAWIWKSWWESKVQLKETKARRQMASAPEQQAQDSEDVNKKYGRYIRVITTQHPTQTIISGKDIPKD